MGIFSSKSKDKEIEVNFSMMDGISGIPQNSAVAVGILDQKLVIRNRLGKQNPYFLDLSKITRVEIITNKEILEKQKTVGGRAVVGGLVLGPLGAIVGGMSGIGSKRKEVPRTYLVINYTSGSDKALSFEIVGASMGWKKLYDRLKSLSEDVEDSHEL